MDNNFTFNIKKFWKYIAILYAAVVLFFILLANGFLGEMPSLKELENPKNHLASEVYSEDGSFIGKIYTHNRVPCTFKELPQNLVNALISTEDSRFYIHSGIDPKAMLGVIKGVFTGDNRGGGSTITQQLAKNLFPRGDINKLELVLRKFKEWIIAIKLERNFTKHEIIAAYFNTVEFSDNAFGVKAAARTYFDKNLKDLTTDEAAILVGMLKAPYKYNPRIHPEESKERRNVVLEKMKEYNFLTADEYTKYSSKPIELHFNNEYHIEDKAPYFVSYLRKYLKAYFKAHPKKDGTVYDIYSDGLKIHTTLNMKLQGFAEEAVSEHLKYYQSLMFSHWRGGNPWHGRPSRFMKHIKESDRYKDLKAQGKSEEEILEVMKTKVRMKIFTYKRGEVDTLMSPWDSIYYYKMFLQTGFLAIDPRTGYVKAWVGGANFDYFKYDHVNIGTKRQVGSVFKPFLYTVAVDQKGYSPCFQVPNQRIVFRPGNPKWKLGAAWSPSNSGGGYGGSPTLKMALSKSLNTVSARLMYEVGPLAVIDLLKNLGIDSSTKIPPYPSICLGTPEISVYEMIGAYIPYANEGIYIKPSFISKIEDMHGNIIYENYPQYKEVLRPEVAYVMQEMMKGVVDVGTAKRLKGTYGLKGDICGKTGTTQSNADGWFIGLTPQLIAGAWVGCDDRLVRFRSTGLGQGAAMALPIWGKFFQKISKDSSCGVSLNEKFPEPDPKTRTIVTDCSKYTGWGKSTYDEPKGGQLIETHAGVDMETKYDNYEEEELEEEGVKPKTETPKPSEPKKEPQPVSKDAALPSKPTSVPKKEIK